MCVKKGFYLRSQRNRPNRQDRPDQQDEPFYAEVQSHLYIALDQGYIDQGTFEGIYNQADKVGKMISGLIKYLRTKQTK